MKEYINSELAKDMPLEFGGNPERYELRLLEDDEEEYYIPIYDIPELDRTKTLSDINVNSLSFCKAKRYTITSNYSTAKAGIGDGYQCRG